MIVEGQTTALHEFGKRVGQAEIESKGAKAIRADYYVLGEGIHNLEMMSVLKLGSAIMQCTSEG
jgi:hypothetical protein